MDDGTKLIFKRKTAPTIKFLRGIFVHFHERGCMYKDGVKLWMENVWRDMFRSHLNENIKNRLVWNNTEIAVIPGGLTLILQPLDACLNEPFNDHMREQWNNWMISNEMFYKKSGAMHAASLDVLCDFMIKSRGKVKVETVTKSFKKCGISNAMDGRGRIVMAY
jgi:hypothetical protein